MLKMDIATRLFGIAGSLGLAMVASFAGPAWADDTGFASAHDLRREGGRLCQVGHYHSGGGTGKNRKAAELDAIKSWSSFTAFEYGSDWAHFSRAASKSMSCSGSGSVDCNVEARPCK